MLEKLECSYSPAGRTDINKAAPKYPKQNNSRVSPKHS